MKYLDLKRLESELRGQHITRAFRSIGSCALFYYSRPRDSAPADNFSRQKENCLMVELADWTISRHGQQIVTSSSWRRAMDAALPKLTGMKILSADIGYRRVELHFEKGYGLRIAPSAVPMPGYRIDQWLLFHGDQTLVLNAGSRRAAFDGS